jgi:S1-C subfamily serine protease
MRIRIARTVAAAAMCLLVTGLGPPAGAQPTTVNGTPEERAAALVRPAVVYLEQEWSAWVKVPRSSALYFEGWVNGGQAFRWATRCSGFVVNPDGYIVTAGHCVDAGEEGARGTALEYATAWLIQQGWASRSDAAYLLNEGHGYWTVEGSEKGSDPDLTVRAQWGVAAGGLKVGKATPARVVDAQSWSEGDVAILKVEESDLPSMLVAPTSEIDIGTPVLSIGYPGSTDQVTDQTLEPTYKDGQINSEKTRSGGLLPVYEMSAALSGGMSGGPTVDLDGQVIGINSFNIRGETEAFNYITPSSLVSEMMARNGVVNELGTIDEAYRAGVEAFYAGELETAIASFEEVLSLAPTHQQAQEMKVEATKLLAEQPEPPPAEPTSKGGEGMPAWVFVLIGVLALGGIAAAALILRRRPAAPPAARPAEPPTVVPMTPPTVAPARQPAGFQPPTGPQASATMEAMPPTPAATRGSAENPHFCSSCGHGLEAGAHYCPECGLKMG